MYAILGVALPEPLQFLNWGWWVIHVIAIIVLLIIGMAIGKSKCKTPSPAP
jgi:hypothetical protein